MIKYTAAKVLTISDSYNAYNQRRLRYYPFTKSDEIKVYYSPSTIDHSLSVCSDISYQKYWLLVSGDRWIKNAIRAIVALDELFSEHPDIEGSVKITGLADMNQLSIEIKNRQRFVCLGYVNEKCLRQLYHNAYAFIYPSLSEGFGYPPLEAMYEGCPVMASAIASIPEVCGDAVLYFNPYSIAEIKMRILQMEDKSVREEVVSKGKIRQQLIEKRQINDLKRLCLYILSFLNND